MLKNNRFIRRLNNPSQVALPSAQSSLDKWFLRAVQSATILGVAVAIFGYFYTVRPIYQKALLDEAIAKKEIELKNANYELKTSYERLKGHAIANFILNSGSCSVYTLTHQFEPDFRISSLRGNDIDSFFSKNILSCLRQAASSTPDLVFLQKRDSDAVNNEIERIGLKLDEERLLMLAEIDNFRLRARRDPSFLEKTLKATTREGGKPMWEKELKDMKAIEEAIGELQEPFLKRISDRITNEVNSLDNFSWPETGPIESRFKRRINAFPLPTKLETKN